MIHFCTVFRFTQFAGKRRFFNPFQAVGLGFTASFRQRFGKVGEQDGDPQPEAYRTGKQRVPCHVSGCHGDG